MMAQSRDQAASAHCRRARVACRSGAGGADAHAAGFIRTSLGSSRGHRRLGGKVLPKLRRPLIITARDPHEGGANKLRLRQRWDLLVRFLNHADYIDVELRLASALRPLFDLAEQKRVRRIISFHNFKSTPNARILAAKAREARSHGADIFKVATRTDTPIELGRLIEFMANNRLDLSLAVMGIGKLGAISRVLLARAGSVLIYASLSGPTDVEGQLSLEQLRGIKW